MSELSMLGDLEPLPIILTSEVQRQASEGQCDACPPAAPSSLSFVAPTLTDEYYLPSTLRTVNLDHQHWLVYACSPPAGPVVLNKPALAFLRRFESTSSQQAVLAAQEAKWGRELSEKALEKLLSLRLLVPGSSPMPPLTESMHRLVAWLHVTRNCTLQCTYCYLDHAPEDMSLRTGQGAIDAVFQTAIRYHLSEVKLKYAGGEPTLVFPLVARLHRRAIKWARKSALALDGVVITNGVSITQEMIETMMALGLRLTISLDGLGKYHDCQRYFADGTGSFNNVSETIERALRVGLTPEISITATRRNLPGLPELVEWLLDRDLSFGLDFARADSPQGSFRIEAQRLIGTMQEVFRVIEGNLPPRSQLASLVDRTNLSCPHTRTCGVGVNYLVIDSRGGIAKCQMDLDHTITGVGTDDPLADIRADQSGIQNLPVDEKDDCRDCQWRYWCGGGCPLETYRHTGRWDVKSPYCDVYKALFPGALRLDGLRLLKYGENKLANAR